MERFFETWKLVQVFHKDKTVEESWYRKNNSKPVGRDRLANEIRKMDAYRLLLVWSTIF